jgi:ribosome biogenesis GTPase
MGQSGAGKSTLLNRLNIHLDLSTGEISESLGRGKHTTRHVELHEVAKGLVADTPGFSAIEFLEIEKTDLPKQFPEFVARENECKFRECSHTHEPHCAIKQAVETGEIAKERYDNYLQFLSEIENKRPVYSKNKRKSSE